MIKINGEIIPNAHGKTFYQYVKENNYNISLIAIECNGEILPKKLYETSVISDGDIIEIVNFVGGG